MNSVKISSLGLTALSAVFLMSCQPDPVYVPVYVPQETKKAPAPPRKVTTYKPKPKPVETAEGFRAVEKPATYSN
jgi:hypothetical protein